MLALLGASKLNFATGQDSYLNPSSQIAIDNVEFLDEFGGETVILLFSANEPGVDVTVSTAYERAGGEEALLALGLVEGSPEALDVVRLASTDCGVTQEQVDAAIAAQFGG